MLSQNMFQAHKKRPSVLFCMAAQARWQQRLMKSFIDSLLEPVQKTWDTHQHQSADVLNKVKKVLEHYAQSSQDIADIMKGENLETLGFPISYRKTSQHIQRCLDWLNTEEGEKIAENIQKGILCYRSPEITENLPVLGSPIQESFWGNGNDAASIVLLYALSSVLNIELPAAETLEGGATFYPFENQNFKLNKESIQGNPFFSENGAILLGMFQYGGHRNRNVAQNSSSPRPQLFSSLPEDASSSIALALGLDRHFSTSTLNAAKESEKIKEILDRHEDEPQVGDVIMPTASSVGVFESQSTPYRIIGFGRDLDQTPPIAGAGIIQKTGKYFRCFRPNEHIFQKGHTDHINLAIQYVDALHAYTFHQSPEAKETLCSIEDRLDLPHKESLQDQASSKIPAINL